MRFIPGQGHWFNLISPSTASHMHRNLLLPLVWILLASPAFSQTYRVYGKIINKRLEPLPFASVQVREQQHGTLSKEDGSYELRLEEGRYDVVVSMIGYRSQVINIIVQKADYKLDLILEEEEAKALSGVVVKGKAHDRAEEIMRQVIMNKERHLAASGAYSCKIYIRAVQEDSLAFRKKKNIAFTDTAQKNRDISRMSMAEVLLQLDYESPLRLKEERLGVTKRGNPQSLFYLSVTEGDFHLYRNLLKAPGLSQTPFVSPVSSGGLLSYRFKTLKTVQQGAFHIYTISIKPRQVSNATVEGEIVVSDSSWIVLHSRFHLPTYHLPEYDFFEVEQEYGPVEKAWMMTRQKFTYYSKTGRSKTSGQTIVQYHSYVLNQFFPKNYFGTEISATAQEAYEKDSVFWQQNRSEPLTEKEMRFIRYKDSLYRVVHAEAYLDSLDKKINQLTWKKAIFSGQTFNDHKKERTWYIPPLPSLYQPFQLGGSRINLSFFYGKRYPSKKNISLYTDLSYGLRNKDVNGNIRLSRMYNPFNRGFYTISLGRSFQYIFQGDAWINMLKRSNIYLNNGLGIGHGLELANGLFLYTDIDAAFRHSVSHYKTNPHLDSLLGDFLTDNQAVAFDPYNAVYGKIRLQYTPRQRYIREPKEKIILGSAWPGFYTMLRKGIPGPFNSKVNFDYLEFGLEQEIKIGLVGISRYTIKTGSFLSRKDLRLIDYQFQRRGDPFLFMNPDEAFQALDSTFAVFKRFYQGHYVHEFNGALINKIPILKKLQLREVGGGGFLLAPERDLRYVEAFAGVERIFKWPFNPDTKFKFGVYVVGSAANQFRNPVQFKIGVTSWDKRRNKWF